jgi:uncharacterized OsmC-like protein
MNPTERNGLPLELLDEVTDAIRGHPSAARVAIRTRHRWDGGLAVDGRAHELESDGEVTARTFSFRTDWPVEVGGQDSGPSPGEVLLAALGGCVGMTYILNATAQGVDIGELEIAIEAGWDVRGAFALDGVHPGLAAVSVSVSVRSDADPDVLDRIGELTTRTSAVFNSLAHPVPMELSVRRL